MSQKKLPEHWGIILTLISTLGFSIYPIFGKLVFAGGANFITVLFVRFTLSALFFWSIILSRGGFPRLPWKLWLMLFFMGGLAYASMAGLYLSSVAYIPASLASLLLYTYPMLVAFLSVITRQEVLSWNKVAGIISSALGLVLILGVNLQGVNLTGVFLALGAAVVYTIYIVIGSVVLKERGPLVSTAIITSSAALSYGLVGHFVGFTWSLSISTWFFILGIAFFCTIVAVFTFLFGVQSIGPTSASIISSLEPVMTFIFAILLFQERLTTVQGLGGLLVLMGGIFAIYQPKRSVPLEPIQELLNFSLENE